MSPLKLGVVGIGRVARDNYLPFLARQAGVSLGYFNRTPAAATAAAAAFGGRAFAALEELAQWDPDSVLVLTSETVRAEVATALIELGVRRLFLEKPLAAAAGQAQVTEEDFFAAQRLLALAEARGCEAAIVFNYRFFDQVVAARTVIAARDFGAILNVTGFVHFACWSHCLDLIRFLGGNFAEISALPGRRRHRSEEIATAATDVAAAFTLENGATGTVLGTVGACWSHPLYELLFNFERGRLQLRDLDGALDIFDRQGDRQETQAIAFHRSRWDQYRDSFDKALAAYLASLRAGTAPPVPAREGLLELQAEAALRRSIAQGRPVRVQAEFPLPAPREA